MVLVKKDLPADNSDKAPKPKKGGGRSRDTRKSSSSSHLPASKSQPKVAIVHDWLYGGGAELVVEQLHEMFPDAPIYASWATPEWRQRLDDKVVTGWLGWWPFNRLHKFLGPLRILWYTHLKLEDYDLVISSSGAEAKGIKVDKPIHINYCHAPTHYYWSRYDEYMKHPGFGLFNPLARLGLMLLVKPLRRWDYRAAQRPDYIIANSEHIKDEIYKYYKRKSVVVHPPVYFERFAQAANQSKPRRGFVISGRQTAYKRFDLAVEACTKLDLPLTVIGDGPDHRRLRDMAGAHITFLGRVPDKIVEEEFAGAEALIFPGLDDFGITPVEAMAAGTPVIAYRGGGALDYVVPGKTGEFFDEPTITSLAQALRQFDAKKYTSKDCRAQAKKFAKEEFRRKMQLCINRIIAKSGQTK